MKDGVSSFSRSGVSMWAVISFKNGEPDVGSDNGAQKNTSEKLLKRGVLVTQMTGSSGNGNPGRMFSYEVWICFTTSATTGACSARMMDLEAD